jgi:hypothetical protein
MANATSHATKQVGVGCKDGGVYVGKVGVGHREEEHQAQTYQGQHGGEVEDGGLGDVSDRHKGHLQRGERVVRGSACHEHVRVESSTSNPG